MAEEVEVRILSNEDETALVTHCEEDTTGNEETHSKVPEITLRDVHSYSPGDDVYFFLPSVPVIATVTPNTGGASTGRKIPRLHIVVKHGPFKWSLNKLYREALSLRRDLMPLRSRIKRHRRETLPPLLKVGDINVRQATRLRKQVPKVQTFLNAVLASRTFRAHLATVKFLEVSRISFVQETGQKRKEGLMTKRSGGYRRVTNCLGCTACCVCPFSVWRDRWFILKDSCLIYIRPHKSRQDRYTVGGVVLFDTGMTFNHGLTHTRIQHGIMISTQSRELLMRAHSYRSMQQWVTAITEVMETTAVQWLNRKPHFSFAPERELTTGKWYVDGKSYMAAVADAILRAKEEIYITDWMISPHIFLKREGGYSNRLEWRLDTLLLKKAREGVRIFIQLYKEVQLAIDLGGEYAVEVLKHPNIVAFRDPDHISAGVYLWAHHEKIIIIDQTLAFVGGIDLAFGRWDTHSHQVHDDFTAPPPHHISSLASAAISGIVGGSPTLEETDGESVQRWVGKDYYNPFIKDFTELHEPLKDQDGVDRSQDPRMPWHDVSSCVYGAAARDVARHFIQRYNFTKRAQEIGDSAPCLLPRKSFSPDEDEKHAYLWDLLSNPDCTSATVQALRSSAMWSAGIPLEHSIMTAWINAIDKAEHFIYIEQQFFISSLIEDDVINGVAEALRLRIARAHREGKTFRVIVVMPLLPSFEGEFGETSGAILEAVIHWNYHSIARGKESLFGKLQHRDNIPEEEIVKYISVYGLRNHGELRGKLVSEIVYVHSKCMIVDDRITIIGSANINDRSMRGDRDSEVALRFEDKEMIESTMNGEAYSVGKFSHSLRCHLFKEHLGLLECQQKEGVEPTSISVEDPTSDEFYFDTWVKTAHSNTETFEEVFGGKMLPADSVREYSQLREFREKGGLVESDPDQAREAVKKVEGVLVKMPLLFLEKENLLPDFPSKEAFAPDALVT